MVRSFVGQPLRSLKTAFAAHGPSVFDIDERFLPVASTASKPGVRYGVVESHGRIALFFLLEFLHLGGNAAGK